ncbi:hypothetical protein ACFX15_022499 [Malus domestica]
MRLQFWVRRPVPGSIFYEQRYEESQIAADINLVTCSFCPSKENPSGGSRSNYPYVEISLGVTRAAITHLSSGVTHESACADGARGRRAMLVCRVSAGRVSKQLDLKRCWMAGLSSLSSDLREQWCLRDSYTIIREQRRQLSNRLVASITPNPSLMY